MKHRILIVVIIVLVSFFAVQIHAKNKAYTYFDQRYGSFIDMSCIKLGFSKPIWDGRLFFVTKADYNGTDFVIQNSPNTDSFLVSFVPVFFRSVIESSELYDPEMHVDQIGILDELGSADPFDRSRRFHLTVAYQGYSDSVFCQKVYTFLQLLKREGFSRCDPLIVYQSYSNSRYLSLSPESCEYKCEEIKKMLDDLE